MGKCIGVSNASLMSCIILHVGNRQWKSSKGRLSQTDSGYIKSVRGDGFRLAFPALAGLIKIRNFSTLWIFK